MNARTVSPKRDEDPALALIRTDYQRALAAGEVPLVGREPRPGHADRRRRQSFERWAYDNFGISTSTDHGWDRRGSDARGNPRRHAVPLSAAFALGEREAVKIA